MNQAERIIARFNTRERSGARILSEMIGCSPTTVYRWTYPRERGGTGGYVPAGAIDRVKRAALEHGIVLVSEDWEA